MPIRNTTSVLEGERDNPSKTYPFDDAIDATDPDHKVYNHLCAYYKQYCACLGVLGLIYNPCSPIVGTPLPVEHSLISLQHSTYRHLTIGGGSGQ